MTDSSTGYDTLQTSGDPLDEAIRLNGRLPLAWRLTEGPLSDAELLSINENNLMLLNAIAVVEVQRHTTENDDHDAVHLELQRLEAKLDLVLGLVTRLLGRQQQVPALADVSLSARSLQWPPGAVSADAGQHGVIELHVHQAVAVSLSLPVLIEADNRATIYGLGAVTQNALEKFLFRQHRRAIAVTRQTRG